MGTQILPCRKKVKRQLTVIIWTNLVDLESMMLYTKIRPLSFLGSGDEDFLMFYHIWTWRSSKLMDRDHLYKFQSSFNRRLHMRFEENWPRGFRGEVVQTCGRTDGRRTASDHNSSSWAFGSGELKRLSLAMNAFVLILLDRVNPKWLEHRWLVYHC